MIYTICKETKRDNGESYDLWLAAVVDKILLQSGIRGVMVGQRILNVFKKKIISLQSAFKRASKSGGKCVTKLLNVWELGKKYRFTIYYKELDVVNIEYENRKLKGEKRKLEESLEEETARRLKTEEQLKTVKDEVETSKKTYKKKFRDLVNKVAKLNRKKNSRGPDKKKKFTDYSKQHQARVRKQIREQCQSSLSFLGHYDFVPTRVELLNYDSGEVETVFLENEDLLLPEAEEKSTTDTETDDLNMWLYIKDKFNLSNKAWLFRLVLKRQLWSTSGNLKARKSLKVETQ